MSRRASTAWFVVAGLAIALVLAFVVSPHANANPDGLSKVAIDQHLDTGERAHALADGPLSGYAVHGVHHAALSKGLAGVVGVMVTFGLALALSAGLRRRTRRSASLSPTA